MKKDRTELQDAYNAYTTLKTITFDLFEHNKLLKPEEIQAIAIDMLHQSMGVSHKELIGIWYKEWSAT